MVVDVEPPTLSAGGPASVAQWQGAEKNSQTRRPDTGGGMGPCGSGWSKTSAWEKTRSCVVGLKAAAGAGAGYMRLSNRDGAWIT